MVLESDRLLYPNLFWKLTSTSWQRLSQPWTSMWTYKSSTFCGQDLYNIKNLKRNFGGIWADDNNYIENIWKQHLVVQTGLKLAVAGLNKLKTPPATMACYSNPSSSISLQPCSGVLLGNPSTNRNDSNHSSFAADMWQQFQIFKAQDAGNGPDQQGQAWSVGEGLMSILVICFLCFIQLDGQHWHVFEADSEVAK